jgi:Zn-dependent M28 family amino/carboxypeptidase
MIKYITTLIIACTSVSGIAQINVKHIKKDISYLASDKLKGRGTSSAEEKIAATYIASSFKKSGLVPKGNDSYLYNFVFKKNSNPHDTSLVNIPERKGINVIGFLDNSAVNTIVIGAHYDHLGLGHDHNSLDANPEDKIHNGADDNASGTSGVLELAKYFSENNVKENYNFLFICFSGEELGLLGSKKWCDNPTIDLTKINYMINMDMIGRLNDSTKKLLIYGVGTSPTWVPLLQKTNAYFSIKMDSSGIGPSDQTSFYLKDIPVLHFFTGQHSDYHKPTDDVEKINLAGEKKVLEYIVDLINQTNSLPKLTFAKTASPVSTKSKYKVTLGVMPDYTFEGTGMRIDGVTDNKPAFKAGIKTGDIIIELGGQKINNVQDYMKALSGFNKGDKTIVGVKRGNENLSLALEF